MEDTLGNQVFLNGIWKPNANTDLPVKVLNHVRTRSFSIEELRTATQNFNQEIGKGDFGTVFYGKLLDEKEIAVKVLSSSSKQGLLEFLYEKDLLSRLNHKNLVWLLGYCNSSKELMLVYEYVGGGSLRDYLHGGFTFRIKCSTYGGDTNSYGSQFNVARLEYLHSRSRPKIIHRDVKSSNILLDLNMRAKVAEYFSTNKLTERNDVYSFGVVLLEIICGRKPIEDAACEEEVNLVRWVMLHAEAKEDTPCRLTNIIDKREGSKRPTMNEIVAGIRVGMLYIEPRNINAEKSVYALPTEEYGSADCSSSLRHAG
ncbi:hypothetical protein SUGI_0687720 [Cryptomeria japonica]|nr:hypothetical protein SUGI_0687720 [Cryptomeria japonica]